MLQMGGPRQCYHGNNFIAYFVRTLLVVFNIESDSISCGYCWMFTNNTRQAKL